MNRTQSQKNYLCLHGKSCFRKRIIYVTCNEPHIGSINKKHWEGGGWGGGGGVGVGVGGGGTLYGVVAYVHQRLLKVSKLSVSFLVPRSRWCSVSVSLSQKMKNHVVFFRVFVCSFLFSALCSLTFSLYCLVYFYVASLREERKDTTDERE